MLSLPDAAAIRAALNQPLDVALHRILKEIASTAEMNGVEDMTHVLVMQSDDQPHAIKQELGWSPVEHPIDRSIFGEACFEPYWAWLQKDQGYFRLIHSVGNSGFAYVILVEDAPEEAPSSLLRMCRHYAGRLT